MTHSIELETFNDLVVFVGDEATPIKVDVEKECGRIFVRNERLIFRNTERPLVRSLREVNADKLHEAVREATR